MLAHSDFVREFPVVLKTDRDCETPLVTEFVKARAPIGSLLDVGAHYSGHHYAEALRFSVLNYHGIDIQPPDDKTKGLLNRYITGNVNTFTFDHSYDAVICVSTIEHAGISTYKGDYFQERHNLFFRCFELAKQHMWISFPVGQEHECPGQMAIITMEHFRRFLNIAKSAKRVQSRFFYSQGPQAGHPWYEHTKPDVAFKVPYMEFVGNQSICVMEIDR